MSMNELEANQTNGCADLRESQEVRITENAGGILFPPAFQYRCVRVII